MSDLDQIVNLRSARDVRLANTGAVNASVGLNFHVIFDHRRPGLDNFVPAAGVIVGKAKTIAAKDYAMLEDEGMTNAAGRAQEGMRLRKEVIVKAGARIDHDMWQRSCVPADASTYVH